MNFFFTSARDPSIGWTVFISVLLLIGIIIAGFVVWIFLFRKFNPRPRRKRKRKHSLNPTLAQTHGLPPLRDPNQPPPGP